MLKTMGEVIATLGGDFGLREMLGVQQNNITNWKHEQQKFPAKYYLIMSSALARRSCTASPELWGILPARD